MAVLPGMEDWVDEEGPNAEEVSREAQEAFEARDDVPWMKDYYALRQEGWPWRVAVYIAWASTPAKGRWPKTQEELATQVLGLRSSRAIRRWKEKNPAIEDRILQAQRELLFMYRRDVFEALVESASDPSPRSHPDRRLYLEMVGEYTPKQELTVGASDLEEADEAELRALAAAPGEDDGVE